MPIDPTTTTFNDYSLRATQEALVRDIIDALDRSEPDTARALSAALVLAELDARCRVEGEKR